MSTVLPSPARFNDSVTVADLSSANGDYTCRPGGHMDECIARQTQEDWPDDAAEALAEMVDDQTLSAADTLAAGELQAAYSTAREETGLCGSVMLRRSVQFGSTSADVPAARQLVYTCTMVGANSSYTGIGDSAGEAVVDALKQLDAACLVPLATGGYRIRNVGSILAAPYRSDAEARQFGRRFALDPEFVAAVMAWSCPGVVDHRQPQLPLAPTAA